MITEEVKKKIKEDLIKSGYSSEMKALKIFKNYEWRATACTSYYDLDEEKTRESDIKAYIANYNGDLLPKVNIIYTITAEVKKSEKPWIIFKEIPTWSWQLKELWNSLIIKEGLDETIDYGNVTDVLSNFTLGVKLGWLGSNIHEFQKSPNNSSRSFSALVSVCKAAEDELTWGLISGNDTIQLGIVKPLIILDGHLLSAEIVKDNIEIEEIDSATIDFNYATKKYNRGNYKVDLVTLNYLPDYIELARKRCDCIFEALKTVKKNIPIKPNDV
ncbi:MAG: hypothetical protein AB2L13_20135 [Spirochaetota bacterium]|jgi:hypothetical protein